MKKRIIIFTFLIIGFNIYAQSELAEYIGVYGDWMPNGETLTTKLDLKKDGTYKLKAIKYSYKDSKYNKYINIGEWIANGKGVTLNPGLIKRTAKVTITEKQIKLKDSIEIKINLYLETYNNQKLVSKEKINFEMLTIYINKRRKNLNLRHQKYIRNCGLAPRIGHQKIIDTTNTFRIVKKEIKKIGILTYGIDKAIETKIQNTKSNSLEINIVIPIDKERMPRNKKVIIKGNRAYIYEINGKVNTNWFEPLYKKTAQ